MRALKICIIWLCLTTLPSFAASPDSPRVHVGKQTSHHHRRAPPREKCLFDEWFSRSYHPTYYLKGTGADGETLTMNDETVWVIAGNSTETVASWALNSPIVISPSRWYSKYGYYITNTRTNETATAKLSQGPFVKYAIFIQQIDWNSGFVSLSNGTRWTVRPSRSTPWQTGQAVLIGQNSGWTGYILVNINQDTYLEAGYLR